MTTLTMLIALTFVPLFPAPEAAPEMVCEEVANFDATEFEAIPEIPFVEETLAAPLPEEQDSLPLVSSVPVSDKDIMVITAKFEPRNSTNSFVVKPVNVYRTLTNESVNVTEVQPLTSGRRAKVLLIASAAVRPVQNTNFGQLSQVCEICLGRPTTKVLILEDPRMEQVVLAKATATDPTMHFTPTVHAPKRVETSVVELEAKGGLMEMLRDARKSKPERFAKVKNIFNLLSKFKDEHGNRITAAQAMKLRKGQKVFLELEEDPKGSRQMLADMSRNIRT